VGGEPSVVAANSYDAAASSYDTLRFCYEDQKQHVLLVLLIIIIIIKMYLFK